MTLTPIMLYCQLEILERLYPDLSLDEARNKESSYVIIEWWYYKYSDHQNDYYYVYDSVFGWFSRSFDIDPEKTIIGLPPTLPRVLTALGGGYIAWDWHISIWEWDVCWNSRVNNICDRQLLNEDKTDATLFDQKESTILSVAKLLWYKE